jgi:hypothetical protein
MAWSAVAASAANAHAERHADDRRHHERLIEHGIGADPIFRADRM